MYCDYCGIRESKFITKNGKNCCEKYYQSCPSIKEKNGKSVSESLKKQYENGDRISHFKTFNDGSFWAGKNHTDETKKKISEIRKGKTFIELYGSDIAERYKKLRSDEMKIRYSNGWESTAGRTKKLKYISPIAGEVFLDGSWEFKVAEYLDNINVKWIRNKKRFDYIDNNNKHRTYCPDFYIFDYNTYVEVKGYKTELDSIKWSQFTEKLEIWDKIVLQEKNII